MAVVSVLNAGLAAVGQQCSEVALWLKLRTLNRKNPGSNPLAAVSNRITRKSNKRIKCNQLHVEYVYNAAVMLAFALW